MMTKLAISGYLAPSIFLIDCRPSQAEWSRNQRLPYLYLVSVMVCDVYHGLTNDKVRYSYFYLCRKYFIYYISFSIWTAVGQYYLLASLHQIQIRQQVTDDASCL